MSDKQKDNSCPTCFGVIIGIMIIMSVIYLSSRQGELTNVLIIHVDYNTNTLLVNGRFINKELIVDAAEQFSTGDICTIEWRQPKLFGDLYAKNIYCTDHVHYIQMEMYE